MPDKKDEINRELLSFIDRSPNAYFAVRNLADMLEEHGYIRLYEEDKWSLEVGSRYYVIRDDSSIIAFRLPDTGASDGSSLADSDTYNSETSNACARGADTGSTGISNTDTMDALMYSGFNIIASHSDSPAFKIKPNAEITVENSYIKLNTEKYGGMIMSTWLDRPLSVAGRVVVRTEDGVETRLVNVDRDLCIIPSLAIHMDRKTNDGYVWNAQRDMLPLFAQLNMGVGECGNATPEDGSALSNLTVDKIREDKSDYLNGDKPQEKETDNLTADKIQEDKSDNKNVLLRIVADAAGVSEQDILDTDLFLYNRNKGIIYGADNEFIGSGRLDDLQCAFASMKGFVEAGTCNVNNNCGKSAPSIPVCCVFNNEEVGSSTKQGAASSFLEDVLTRINHAFSDNEEEIRRMLAGSFLISADNAHAVHPNHTDKADPTNRPMLNEGIVIKYNANQKYTTDAVSGGIFRRVCELADVPVQTYVNRSDIAGGSTLGSIATTRVSINAVDIGLPQLAMHSAYETAGAMDTVYLVCAAKKFYSSSINCCGDGKYRIL